MKPVKFSNPRLVAERMLTDEDRPPSPILLHFGEPGIDKTAYIIERLNPRMKSYLYYKYDQQLSDEEVGQQIGYGISAKNVSLMLYSIFKFITGHFIVNEIVETRRVPDKIENLLFSNYTSSAEILKLPAHEREYYLSTVTDECSPEMKRAALSVFRIVAGELSPDTRELLKAHRKKIEDFKNMTRTEIICVPWLHHSSLEEVLAYLNK